MDGQASVILLEFNELTPSLMTRFMNEGVIPNFKRLRDQLLVFTTDAQESVDNLEPWIQWVTVHTGLSAKEHGIRQLGQAEELKWKALTQLLSEAKRRVLIFGSMNGQFPARAGRPNRRRYARCRAAAWRPRSRRAR